MTSKLQVKRQRQKFDDDNFTCVGVHHARDPEGSIILDQHEYIGAMNPVRHPDLTGSDANGDCSEAVTRLFWSLLGQWHTHSSLNTGSQCM